MHCEKRCVNVIPRPKKLDKLCVFILSQCQTALGLFRIPEGPGPYACLVCKPGHTGQDPASLTGTRDCVWVCVCVCIHLLQLRWAVWHITPDPTPLGEDVCMCVCVCGLLRLHTADVACVDMRPPVNMWTFICLHQAPPSSIFISISPAWPHPPQHTHTQLHHHHHSFQLTPQSPLLLYLCVLYQMGCQGHLWPPAARWLMGQPSPVTRPPPSIVPWRASDTAWTHLLTLPPHTWAS